MERSHDICFEQGFERHWRRGIPQSSSCSKSQFVLKQLSTNQDGKLSLFRSYREGEAKGDGVLEDYSFFINGLIDLYEASFEPKYIETAISLCESMLDKFHDSAGGGFFLTDTNTKNLIVRAKDAYDGAIPSGNSMAALACCRLAEFSSREDLRSAAKDTFEAFWSMMSSQPSAFTAYGFCASILPRKYEGNCNLGRIQNQRTRRALSTLRSEFVPNAIVLLADKRLEKLTTLVQERISLRGEKAKVFVCSNFTCKLPSETQDDLRASLRE